jgi:hypothetical protein
MQWFEQIEGLSGESRPLNQGSARISRASDVRQQPSLSAITIQYNSRLTASETEDSGLAFSDCWAARRRQLAWAPCRALGKSCGRVAQASNENALVLQS